jgi:ABC-type hemin transport system substrate-binding protein
MRIVSLVPSSTETLLELGADVVACTRFCEQPQLRHVGGTKNPEIGAIVALRPDVVVVDREENRREDADALSDAGLDLFVSDVRSVDSALAVVDELATLVGCHHSAVLPSVTPVGGTAFVPIWRRPWMSISDETYGGSLLAQLGIELVTASSATPYPAVDLDELRSPDLVLVPSEPYEFIDSHLDELRRALPDTRVIRVDGQDLFWWGIRTPAALARLAVAIT